MNASINFKKNTILEVVLDAKDNEPKSVEQIRTDLESAGLKAQDAKFISQAVPSIATTSWIRSLSKTDFATEVKIENNKHKPLGLEFIARNDGNELSYKQLPASFQDAAQTDIRNQVSKYLTLNPNIADDITLG